VPTAKQKAIDHAFWFDTPPCAQFRDNLIEAKDTLNRMEICSDFVGGIYRGLNEVELRGWLIWGEPWTEDGWEVTEGFARRWGFLLKGCETLMRSTNRWRASRGEDPLVIEI
jgi:hypothetical protein